MSQSTSIITKSEIIIFSRQLALVIESEVSLVEGLFLIQSKTNNKGFYSTLEDLIKAVQGGQPLGVALKGQKGYFPNYFIHMIEIGEESGDLASILVQIADTYEKEEETIKKVKSAVTYPIILTLLMLGVIGLLVIKILPMFNDILVSLGGSLPPFTGFIMEISFFIGSYGVFLVLGIVLLFVGLFLYKRTESGSMTMDALKFKMPIQKNIMSSLSAVRFSRNLGLLIKSGINISLALAMIKPIMNNRFLESKIDEAISSLNEGKSLSEALESLTLFPWVLIQLFAIAQNTGHMDRVLFKAAEVMEDELDTRLNRLTTVIEPALILILSIIVGIILISVILPIVDIMNAIG